MFVKRTLTYLAVSIIQGRKERGSGGGGGGALRGIRGVGLGGRGITLSEYVVCMWEMLGEPMLSRGVYQVWVG